MMGTTTSNRLASRRTFLKSTAAMAAASSLSPLATSAQSATLGSGVTPRRPALKLGLASYTTRKLSLAQTIRIASRLDLGFLCLKEMHLAQTLSAAQIRQEAKTVRDAGLDLYGGGVIQLKTVAQIDTAFQYARAAGMRTIIGVPARDQLDLVEERVKEHGIRVAIHNHGPGDNLYPTPESAYEQIKDRDPGFGLCIDVGHTLRSGVDPAGDVLAFGDRLLDIHLKDIDQARPEGHSVVMGRGVLDIPAVLGALQKINYRNVVGFEYEQDADDPLPGLAECVGYTRGVLAVL